MRLTEAQLRKLMDKSEANFNKWKDTFNLYLTEMVNELQTDYLNQLGLTIRINPKYIFNGGKSRWLASYERRSQQILQGIISIGINYPLLYSEMRKRGVDKDKFNIEAQARITIGHEIGHGLVDYIRNLKLEQSLLSKLPNVIIVRKCRGQKEETLVEEFGEYQFPEATSCWDSILSDALEELNNINNNDNSNMKKSVRLTEGNLRKIVNEKQLNKIIEESIRNVIRK